MVFGVYLSAQAFYRLDIRLADEMQLPAHAGFSG